MIYDELYSVYEYWGRAYGLPDPDEVKHCYFETEDIFPTGR